MQLLQRCYKKKDNKKYFIDLQPTFSKRVLKGISSLLAGVLRDQEQIWNLLLMAQITSKTKHSKLNAAKIYDQQYLLFKPPHL